MVMRPAEWFIPLRVLRGPAYAQVRAGISDLVDHAADVWVLDTLPFGGAAKGTIGPAPYAATNRHADETA